MLIGWDTIFTRIGSVLANRAGREMSLLIGPDTTFFVGLEVSLLMGLDITFIRMGNFLANRVGYHIY